jgi:hypothetical protein
MKHYLARRLHLPSGEVLERHVVAVGGNGYIVEWYPFVAEFQSMLFVDDLYLCEGENAVPQVMEVFL